MILQLYLGFVYSFLIHNVQYDLSYGVLVLLTLVIFQMIGGVTDFIAHGEGMFIIRDYIDSKKLTLSFITVFFISSIYPILNAEHYLFYEWYLLVCVGFIYFRCSIRYGIGVLRGWGYNRRTVALVGRMQSGVELFNSFREQPWLVFLLSRASMMIHV